MRLFIVALLLLLPVLALASQTTTTTTTTTSPDTAAAAEALWRLRELDARLEETEYTAADMMAQLSHAASVVDYASAGGFYQKEQQAVEEARAAVTHSAQLLAFDARQAKAVRYEVKRLIALYNEAFGQQQQRETPPTRLEQKRLPSNS